MSASKPKNYASSPATCFLKFDAEEGSIKLTFRDSDLSINPISVRFAILDDDFKTVGGYSSARNKGIRCNVCHGQQDWFKVSYEGGEKIAQGPWKNIKTIAEGAGGRFQKQLYAILLSVNTVDAKVIAEPSEVVSLNKRLAERKEIVKIDLGGLTLSSYLEFTKRLRFSDMGLTYVQIAGFEDRSSESFKKKTFKVPAWQGRRLKQDVEAEKAIHDDVIRIDGSVMEPYRQYILKGGSANEEPEQEATAADFARDNGLSNGYEPVTREPLPLGHPMSGSRSDEPVMGDTEEPVTDGLPF